MERFVRLNVAVIPPKNVSDFAIEISKKFSRDLETEFALDGKEFNPHITCYPVEYPQRNLLKVSEYVESIAGEDRKFLVNLTGLEISQEGNAFSVGIAVVKNKEIDNLHRGIIEKLNPLREGHLREVYKNPNYIEKFPPDKREIMKKILSDVGYARVLDVYDPHISITQFKPEVKRSDIDIPEFAIRKMPVSALGI